MIIFGIVQYFSQNFQRLLDARTLLTVFTADFLVVPVSLATGTPRGFMGAASMYSVVVGFVLPADGMALIRQQMN